MLRAFLLAALLATGPALAQSTPPRDTAKDAEDMAREAIDKLMRAMSMLIQSIPQYETPEMLPNGDIVIRRKQPAEPKATPKPQPKEDKT